jgi:Tol biopolymer transport system component
VKQIATGSEVTVVPQQAGYYSGGAFSPDGNYLYYVHTDPANANNSNVYVVPSMGGASRQLVSDVVGGISLSPDGKRMAFVRQILEKNAPQVMVATDVYRIQIRTAAEGRATHEVGARLRGMRAE